MSTVTLSKLALKDYAPIVGAAVIEEATNLGESLAGKSVVHVNSTSYGGGVAEILHRLVPLMCDVGLDASWQVIEGGPEFFRATKRFHNALQGAAITLTADMKRTYQETAAKNAARLTLDRAFTVIHDPQPLPIITQHPHRRGHWVWRCHIDISQPHDPVLQFLQPFIRQYDVCIFSMQTYAKRVTGTKHLVIIPPSIDPLSDKNKPLSETQVESVLDRFDVDPERPIITQVARFDPWKDPVGVIDVYRQVRQRIPGLQLLLIASMAADDPEGWTYYEKTARHAGEDYDIHLLTDLIGVHDVEVNALQRASDVILAKSLREGFGLTVTEALWKGVPVIGGDVGGIALQIRNGVSGFLVHSVEEAAQKTTYLLEHPENARAMGEEGKHHVLRNFLITRQLIDYLRLFATLAT
jgi:trehalose synthase